MSPNLPHRAVDSAAVIAVFAAVIGIGILAGAAGLFPRDGAPLDRPVIAERACIRQAPVARHCARPPVASAHAPRIAVE